MRRTVWASSSSTGGWSRSTDAAGTAAAQDVHVRIIAMTAAHGAAVLAIYQAGIDGGDATFETEAPEWGPFDAARLPAHRFVAVTDSGEALGWVACSPVSNRSVYAGVVEHSVYVSAGARGHGVG